MSTHTCVGFQCADNVKGSPFFMFFYYTTNPVESHQNVMRKTNIKPLIFRHENDNHSLIRGVVRQAHARETK